LVRRRHNRPKEKYAEEVRERLERQWHRRTREPGFELKKMEPPTPKAADPAEAVK
jgi:hypothetical protein